MKKNGRSSKGKSNKRIKARLRFSEKRMASSAGLIPLARFLDKLGIERLVNQTVTVT